MFSGTDFLGLSSTALVYALFYLDVINCTHLVSVSVAQAQ